MDRNSAMESTEQPWEFAPLGDRGLLVQWRGSRETALDAVLALCRYIRLINAPGIFDLVPGIDSLLVCYDPLVTAPAAVGTFRSRMMPSACASTRSGSSSTAPGSLRDCSEPSGA